MLASLNADGTITGAKKGTWTVTDGTNLHLTIDGKEYCIFRIVDDGKDLESVIMQTYPLSISIMEEIAQKHHGFFKIEKNTPYGTECALYIPMGKEHFENEENVVFIVEKL